MHVKHVFTIASIPKVLFVLFLTWLTWRYVALSRDVYLLSQFAGFHFLHMINLVFHEAGHTLFLWAPRQVMMFMGTGLQILIPSIIMIHFLRKFDWFAAGAALWWTFQNIFDSAYYIADAKERSLPLITNDPNTHDWWYLFTEWNLLDQAASIGGIVMYIGIIGMAVSLIAMILVLFLEKKETYKASLKNVS